MLFWRISGIGTNNELFDIYVSRKCKDIKMDSFETFRDMYTFEDIKIFINEE